MAEIAGRSIRLVPALLLALVLAVLLSLGTWQVERLHWKEGLLADIESRRHAPPVSIDAIEAMVKAGEDIEYRTVTLTGTFDNSRERHFLATHDGASGFYVYTPLTMADGRIVFVNRGFVPYDLKEPGKRREGELEGVQTVTGLARTKLAEKPSRMVPDNDIAKDIFYWKDLDAMASSTGLDPSKVLPLFVDVDATPNPGGLPVGGVTQIDLPNDHLQYAFTWYGLAAVLVVVTAIRFFDGGRRKQEKEEP
ncbi:SURF1 family protein [Rhizobium sp. PAMB 3174]